MPFKTKDSGPGKKRFQNHSKWRTILPNKIVMYQKEEHLTTKYCNAYRELNLTSLALLCQEAAIEDVERMGYDRSFTLDRGLLWVIAKQHFDIIRMPKYEEKIFVQTYPGKRLGPFFLRHYRIMDVGHNLLIKGVSVWCLIQADTRSITTLEKANIQIPIEAMGGELDFPKGLPPFEGGIQTSIEAKYSMCDVNGHLNNTKYFDFTCDLIPLDYQKNNVPVSADIHYKKEIPLGTKVEFSYGKDGDGYRFSGTNFDLKINYRSR